MSNPIEPSRTAAVPHGQHSSAASGTDETAPATLRAGDSAVPHFGPPAGAGEVGTLGPYRVLKELGKGGMGAVYLALDTRLDRKLAFKVMLPEFAADTNAKERFLREARAAAKISHDNVVTVFEADERDGVPYIAMQYLQGYPLDEYLKTKGAPALPHVLRIARETALGLAAAHALGLVHRDIKPANLWLEAPNGRVKVLDFGLAKPIGSDADLTKSGAVVGTPAYMSPEQARGQKVDSRTDLFSLGAVLYRLCTGKTPFDGPNVMAVLMALGTEDPTPVRELNPNVPEALAALIHQLLAKKADDRPQTATEVAKRLRTILEQLAAPTAAESSVPMATAADLSTSMPVVVHALPMQPPIVVPMQITAQPESAFANLGADDATHIEPTFDDEGKPKPKSAPKKAGGKGLLIAAGVAVLIAAGALAAVVALKGKTNEPEAKAPDAPAPGDKGKPGPKVTPQPKETAGTLPPLAPWTPPKPVPVGAGLMDKLDPKEIPPEERFDWQPKELVAVIGSHARKHWNSTALVVVSPDDKWAVTTNRHGQQIWVWNLATHALHAVVPLPAPDVGCQAVAFSPDSRTLYLTFNKGLVLYPFLAAKPGYEVWPGWEKADGLFPPAEDNSRFPHFSPDGRTIVLSAADGALQVWDNSAPKPRLVKRVEKPGIFLGFSADRMAVVYVRQEAAGLPWQITAAPLTKDGEPKVLMTTPPENGPIWNGSGPAMALTADGTTLAVLDKGGELFTGTLYDLTATPPKEKGRFTTLTPAGPIQFSPDGKTLARRYVAIELFDATQAPPKAKGRIPTVYLGSHAFTADGKTAVTGEHPSGAVRFWDLSGAEPTELAPIPAGVALSNEGSPHWAPVLAPGKALLGVQRTDNSGQFWDLTGTKPKPWPNEDALVGGRTDGYTCPIPALSPDGLWCVAHRGERYMVQKWTPTGFEEVSAVPRLNRALFDGGKGLVPEGDGGTIALWDIREPLEKAKPLPGVPRKGENANLGAAAISGDRLLAVRSIFSVALDLWNIQGEKPALAATLAADGYYGGLAFSPDGRYLAVCAHGLHVYDLSGKVPKRTPDFPTRTTTLMAVAFTPDAKRVAVASDVGHLEVFDVATQARLWEAKLPGSACWLAFAEDGRHLLTHNANGTIYVLRLPDLGK